jgi:hypothetical protein
MLFVILYWEEFEDIEGVIRICNPKDRQHTMTKRKRTNNDPTHKTKDRTKTHYEFGMTREHLLVVIVCKIIVCEISSFLL